MLEKTLKKESKGSESCLKVGDLAPELSLFEENGKEITLSSFLGKRVVLYFYPKDMTSGCTQESCDFRDLYLEFQKKNTVVLGISPDSSASHQKFKIKHSLPFSLLSDPQSRVCQEYGVWKEKSMYGRKYMGVERTTFVISEEGQIVRIYSKVKVPQHAETVLIELS